MSVLSKKLWDFEGQKLTLTEISRLIPALSITGIKNHLLNGRNTRMLMLSYNGKAKTIAATKKRLSNIHRDFHFSENSIPK